MQGRNEGSRGHSVPGAELLGVPKSPNNVASTFFNTVHLLQKDLSFEHGVSCLGLHLTCVHLSGVHRKFPRGAKFCHDNVMSQSNFKRSAEDTTILGWSRGMPREIFSKLHLKIRIFCAFWKEVLV